MGNRWFAGKPESFIIIIFSLFTFHNNADVSRHEISRFHGTEVVRGFQWGVI